MKWVTSASLPDRNHGRDSGTDSGSHHDINFARQLDILAYSDIFFFFGRLSLRNKMKRQESHPGTVLCVAMSGDSQRLMSGGRDKTIKVWDVQTGDNMQTLKGHRGSVMSMDFSPTGNVLVTGGEEGNVKLWKLCDDKISLIRASVGHFDAVNAVKISPDGLKIATTSTDGNTCIWDIKSVKKMHEFSCLDINMFCVTWSSDSKLVAAGGMFAAVFVWNAQDGTRVLRRWNKKDRRDKKCISLNAQTSILVSAGDDRVIHVWKLHLDKSSGRVAVMHRMTGHKASITSLVTSLDGACIISGSDDKTIRLWDAHTGMQIKLFSGHKGPVTSLAWSPDGSFIVSGGADRAVHVWNVHMSSVVNQV
jgi:WD40 repeat protein